jgi:hypothetical protein
MRRRYYVPVSVGGQFRHGLRILLVCCLAAVAIAHNYPHAWWHYLPFLVFIPGGWLAWRSFGNGWRLLCVQWRVRFGR